MCDDGAAAMTGKTNGFVAQLLGKLNEIAPDRQFHHVYCIIRQQMVHSKEGKMENVLKILKTVNFIGSQGLNQ